METIETKMTNGFYIKTTTVNDVVRRVEVCRRGVILAFASSTEDGIERAKQIARDKGLDEPKVKS